MYWLRWHYHVKDIAGAPYKIKKKERKKRKTKQTTESPTVSSQEQVNALDNELRLKMPLKILLQEKNTQTGGANSEHKHWKSNLSRR